MNRVDFLRAAPETPESFVHAMNLALAGKEINVKKRLHTRRVLLIAALIGALLIAGGAFAMRESELLRRLFPNDQPSKSTLALLQTVDQENTAGGVTARLDEYLYDGQRLAVSFSLASDAKTPLLISDEDAWGSVTTLDGEPVVGLSSAWGEPWGLAVLGGEVAGQPNDVVRHCGRSGLLDKAMQEETLCLTIDVKVYRPLYPLVEPGKAESVRDLECQYGEIECSEGSPLEAFLRETQASHPDEPLSLADTLEKAGIIEYVDTVQLTQTLTPRHVADAQSIRLDAPIVYRDGDVTIVLSALDFSAIGSNFSIDVHKVVSPEVRAAWGAWGEYPGDAMDGWASPMLLRGDGRLLSQGGGGGGGTTTLDPDGRICLNWSYEFGPMADVPDALLLCPKKTQLGELQSFLDQYDIARGLRLPIRNGCVLPPEGAAWNSVQFAPDFHWDEPTGHRARRATAASWSAEALANAFLPSSTRRTKDSEPPKDDRADDGSYLLVNDQPGHLTYVSGALAEPYDVYFGQSGRLTGSEDLSMGASETGDPEIPGYPRSEALETLDQVLGRLGLSRGKTVFARSLTAQTLQAWNNAYIDLQLEHFQKVLDDDKDWARSEIARFEAARKREPPQSGYYLRFTLAYNGLSCRRAVVNPSLSEEGFETGCALSAFVNPDGLLYLSTTEGSIIYRMDGQDVWRNRAPIAFETAKQIAESYLHASAPSPQIDVVRADYEYAPRVSSSRKLNLALVPSWGFYAHSATGVPYLAVSVNAFTGEILP